MFFKVFVFCVTVAIARAGYLQPALRYAHEPAPVAIPAPSPLTYTIPPTIKAEHLPPVVTTSYGYSSGHTPVPAPIIRAEPVPIAPAPVAFAAPAIHTAPLARVALPAPASLAIAAPAPLTYTIPPTVKAEHLPPVVTTSYGYSSGHTPVPAPIIRAEPVPIAPAPVAFAAPAIHAAPLARIALPAPAPLALAGPALHAPALGFAGNFGGSHLAFGRSYATGFGFGHAPAIQAAPFASIGGHFARSFAAPVPAPAPFALGHSSYGNLF